MKKREKGNKKLSIMHAISSIGFLGLGTGFLVKGDFTFASFSYLIALMDLIISLRYYKLLKVAKK